jgi:hypothetical protein
MVSASLVCSLCRQSVVGCTAPTRDASPPRRSAVAGTEGQSDRCRGMPVAHGQPRSRDEHGAASRSDPIRSGNGPDVQRELHKVGRRDIFDASVPYRLPKFAGYGLTGAGGGHETYFR